MENMKNKITEKPIMGCTWSKDLTVMNPLNHQANCRDYYIHGMVDKMCDYCQKVIE
jgi:hypothetical protein